jgi:hypothetical protein
MTRRTDRKEGRKEGREKRRMGKCALEGVTIVTIDVHGLLQMSRKEGCEGRKGVKEGRE